MVNQYYLLSHLPLGSVSHIQLLSICTYILYLIAMEVHVHFCVESVCFVCVYMYLCAFIVLRARVHVKAKGCHQVSSLVTLHLSF